MSKETKALNKISTALGGEAKVQKNEILDEIAENISGGGSESGGGVVFGKVIRGSMGAMDGVEGFTFRDIVPEGTSDFLNYTPPAIFMLLSNDYSSSTILQLIQCYSTAALFARPGSTEAIVLNSDGTVTTYSLG